MDRLASSLPARPRRPVPARRLRRRAQGRAGDRAGRRGAQPRDAGDVRRAAGRERLIPAIGARWLSDDRARREVFYRSDEKPGTIIVDPWTYRLYYLLGNDRAIRYTVGVGRAGRGFAGEATIPPKREWPRWTPTPGMLAREPELYEPRRAGMEGGLENPLGARALYLFRGGRDTLHRIHGTPYPWTVGGADSSGCVRLFNRDDRVSAGDKVIVLPADRAGEGATPGWPPEEAFLPPVAAAGGLIGSDPAGKREAGRA